MNRAITERIRKCLALGRSANEHEAAAALAKARALMDEHGVSEAHLALSEVDEATARASRTRRPPSWESVLAKTVCRALAVECFLDEAGDRKFVGRGPSAEIASYAFVALFRQLKAARADYIGTHLRRCKPGRKRQRADVFCIAWAVSVHEKVAELMPGPAPDAIIGQYIAERYPGLVVVGNRSPKLQGGGVDGDILRGGMAGRSAQLNAGVGSGPAPLALR